MFVTFEGPEGSGKSTALAAVAARLRQVGEQVVCTREPGAGSLGAQIRSLLLEGENIPPETELLLFLADRSNHVSRTVRPALARGEIVLCDRYADSTTVYQGIVRGLDLSFVREGNRFATGHLTPDLTLLLDIDPVVSLARLVAKDRLDSEPLEFHRRVRDGFLALAKEDPDRWVIIDASSPASEVAAHALRTVDERLQARRLRQITN